MSPSAILQTHQLSLYNTSRMLPEQVIAAFAVRQRQLEHIVADIAAEKPRSRPQHHLVVGQRGMGKTMLLARIAAELRSDSTLSSRFIPLVLAEEQYAVDRLSKFWLNCLDSLADAHELAGDTVGVTRIDATVSRLSAALPPAAKDDQPFAEKVYGAFADATKSTGRRPVLLVDNLQLLFERIDEQEQHALRELLMRPSSPILVGTSPTPPQTGSYTAPFYDHFKIHYLRPLDEGEMRKLLVHLADVAQRDDVRQRVLQHPGRLPVLRQLTGGNPRTTLTLFFLYAEDFAPTVFGDLEGLLDRVTPLYKARFEELTPQQQVIASAIANHWDPITAVALGHVTGLPAGTISSQLDRLQKLGVIERTELYGDVRIGYQLAERFFNIWFLMRSASRRQRREVEFLTRFLESFYEPADRDRLARHLMLEDHFSADRYVLSRAVAATLTERATAEELTRHADLTALQEQAAEARTRLRELIDFDSLPAATLAFDDLRKKLTALVPDGSVVSPDDFARTVLGARTMFLTGEREQLAAHEGRLTATEIASVLESVRTTRSSDENKYSAPAVEWLSHWLARGQIRSFRDAADWNRALLKAPDKITLELLLDSLPIGAGEFIDDTTVAHVTRALEPAIDAGAAEWRKWARYVGVELGRNAQAIPILREALRQDPESPWAWKQLGLCLEELGRNEEAEEAYKESISRKHDYAPAWADLGDFLFHMNRNAEAEAALRQAIEADPSYSWGWLRLGRLLGGDPNRLDEAEEAYRQAIARNPEAWLLIDFGELLARLNRFEDAELAFRQAIPLDRQNVWPWVRLGELFRRTHRFSDAETAYRKAHDLRPLWFVSYYLGTLLAEDLSRYDEAERAYRRALELNPQSAFVWLALGGLLHKRLNRFDEAENAYQAATNLTPDDSLGWIALGDLYFYSMHRFDRAVEAYAHAIEGSDATLKHKIIFLRRDFIGQRADAEALFHELEQGADESFDELNSLQEALFAAYDQNWGLSRVSLSHALAGREDAFGPATLEHWLVATAVLLHLNYGTELLEFLEERGDVQRLRPWADALRALNAGDRRALKNSAPEIRATAEIFFDRIDGYLQKLPETTRRRPAPKSLRRRTTRSR